MQIPEEFELLYKKFYAERWEKLRKALLLSESKVARKNLFSAYQEDFDFALKGEESIPRGDEGLLAFYIMDPASIYVAQALGVEEGDKVLDMCAAPGGKALILAESLKESGELIANEISSGRRDRLKKVFQQYIPKEIRLRFSLSGKDGGLFSQSHPQYFNKILIDAPCSGERHLLKNQKELNQWKPSRSKFLAQKQYSLLSGALVASKPGARIVYSTCSLSKEENDDVIGRLLEKKSAQFKVETPINAEGAVASGAEKTEFGVQFLPDKTAMGPIYYCSLKVHG